MSEPEILRFFAYAHLPPRLEVVRSTDVALQLRSALLIAGTVLVFASIFMVQGSALWLQLALICGALAGLAFAAGPCHPHPQRVRPHTLARGHCGTCRCAAHQPHIICR